MGFFSSIGSAVGSVFGGSAGSALGSIGGSLLDRSETRHSAKQQYKYNSWLQSQNEEFQKEMAQNAHQWEIQDLEKAGLNPIISTMGSSAGAIAGSSAPQGTSAGNSSNLFGNKMSELMQMKQISSATDLNKALEKQATSQANKFDIESGLMPKEVEAKIGNMNAHSAELEAKTRVNNAEVGVLNSENALKYAKTTSAKGTKEYMLGKGINQLEKAINTPRRNGNYQISGYKPKYGKQMFGSKR